MKSVLVISVFYSTNVYYLVYFVESSVLDDGDFFLHLSFYYSSHNVIKDIKD